MQKQICLEEEEEKCSTQTSLVAFTWCIHKTHTHTPGASRFSFVEGDKKLLRRSSRLPRLFQWWETSAEARCENKLSPVSAKKEWKNDCRRNETLLYAERNAPRCFQLSTRLHGMHVHGECLLMLRMRG